MNAFDGEDRERLLLASLLAFDEALGGETLPPSADETIVSDPELADRYHAARECIELLDRIRRADTIAPSLVASPAEDDSTSCNDPLAIELPQQLGRFHIQRELGRGGLGIVFLAHDATVGRDVAIKVPRAELFDDGELAQRFEREAMAAARLSHPNIVTLYESARAGQQHFLVSEYCDGPSLAGWLKGRSHQSSPQQAAEIVRQLATAVHHAHSRGVLHRDIKPSNVLLVPVGSDQQDTPGTLPFTPKLSDFGMAKLLESTGDATRSGAILGTPAYMAPEQANGNAADADVRTDVYALGAVLYEILAGAPPFQGTSDLDTLRQLLLSEPTFPRELRSRVPRDLQAVALACLAKRSEDRYPTAQHLAEDLERYLEGRPTTARPPSAAGRLLKWSRRRPALAALSGALMIAAMALVAIVAGYNTLLRDEVIRADAARDRANRENARSRRLLYSANVRLAYETLEANNVSHALHLLERQLPAPGEEDLREFAWYYLHDRCMPRTVPLIGHQGAVFCIAYSPDGQILATAGQDCTVRLWDAATGTSLRVLRGHDGEVTSVAFSPDGTLLVSGSEDGTVRCWNPQTGDCSQTLGGHADHVLTAAFSPDGKNLATGSRDSSVRVWEIASGATEAQLDDGLDVVRAVEFSPDGTKLYAVDEVGQLHVWVTEDWHRAHREKLDNEKLFALAISGDGALLASAGRRMQIDTWSAGETELSHSAFSEGGHREWIQSLDFSKANGTLASGGKDGVIQLWDADSSTPQRSLLGHTQRVWSVTWSPDGLRLASAGGNGEAMIWTPQSTAKQRYPTLSTYANCGVFGPHGRKLYVGTEDGRILVWEPSTRHLVAEILAHRTGLGALAVSPDGEMIASRAKGEPVKVWSHETFEELAAIPTLDESPPMAWAPSGHRLATTDGERTIVVHDIDAGVVRHRITTDADLRQLAFTPDGGQIVSSSDTLVIWELRSGSKVFTLPEEHSNVLVSSDGSLIAAITGANITLIDVSEGYQVSSLSTVGSDAKNLAMSPDGKTLAVALWPSPRVISLWDTRTKQELVRLECDAKAVSGLMFSPDGRRLILTGIDADRNGGVWEWIARNGVANERIR